MKVFRMLMALCLCVVSVSSALQAFEGAEFTESGLQKFYVQGSDVKVANDGIFVNFQGDTLIVQSVYVDAEGAYIAGRGTCRRCGRPNDDMGRCQWPKCPNYGKG